jgi:hypothetical protein
LKEFQDYLNEGILRKINPNNERALDLAEEAKRKLKNLKKRVEKLGVEDESANDYVGYCYDIIMALIRSKMLKEGYVGSGLGAHEAEVAYLEKLNFSKNEIRFADQLRYHRNGILYYGKLFDEDYALKVIEFVRKAYLKLKPGKEEE